MYSAYKAILKKELVVEYGILSEELFHAQIDFLSSNGDSSTAYSGLVSYRQCMSRDDIVLFVDFDKNSQKSQDLLDFFTSHQDDLNAHVTSIIGQKESMITCFYCHVITVYIKDTKSLCGGCGKLIEITCESWIEDEFITSPDDVVSWNSAYVSIAGLHLFSGNKEDFDYSITFKSKNEIEMIYSNSQSYIISGTEKNYKLPMSSAQSSVSIKFMRRVSVKEIRNYIYSFVSFLGFLFGVEVSFGPLVRSDSSIECENGIIKLNPSFWLKKSVRIKETFEARPYINPICDIKTLEENSDIIFERWNDAYKNNSLALSAMEKIYRNPDSISEFAEDIALLVRAVAIFLDYRNEKGKSLPLEARISRAMREIDLTDYLGDSPKLAEVRNADSHSREINKSIVLLDEMPRLRIVALDLFRTFVKKRILLL